MTALFPGSFDPVTLGHLDIIKRASALFGGVVVAVMDNSNKKTVFNTGERVRLLEISVKNIPNVTVRGFSGALTDCFSASGCEVMIRGVRDAADFMRELQYAQAFYKTGKKIETLFFPSAPEHSFISSGMAREAAAAGADLQLLIPDVIIDVVKERFFTGGQ